MLLMQQGEYTAKNKILILLNRICISVRIVVLVLVVRISTIVKDRVVKSNQCVVIIKRCIYISSNNVKPLLGT